MLYNYDYIKFRLKMKIITTPKELKKYLVNINNSIGFVPTMGALHEGHVSLIKEAKKNNDTVVVSIFVNPTQFCKDEDLNKYPRNHEADKKICEMCGVDVLFFPHTNDIYGDDEVSLNAPNVRGYVLEGFTRPTHFSGVLSVVNKLLNIVNPTRAYFGKKDAQQLNLIKLMVKHLFMNIDIIAIDTVRDSDGLALSSRNIYLSKDERKQALKIPSSLKLASSMVAKGELGSINIIDNIRKYFDDIEVFYIEILDREFNKIDNVIIGDTIILVEVKVGTTRLLDNLWL